MEHRDLNELTEQVWNKLHEPLTDMESSIRWKKQMFILINAIAEAKLVCLSSSENNNLIESLDPVDWPSARCLAHQMLDSSLDYIQSIRDLPVWRAVPINIRAAIENESLPEDGQSLSNVCRDVLDYVMPYSYGNRHPRFFGWVYGSGTLGGTLADMVASAMDANTGIGTHSPIFVERTVIKWMRQLFGFTDEKSGGLIISGTSMATVLCMAAARQRALPKVRQDGLVDGPRFVAYVSTETHMCIVRALELLGFGSKIIRRISVDSNFRMNIEELKEAIRNDREQGLVPLCIIGNAGTVNTGAFDDLIMLASIARSEDIWFHVDGAFGSLVILDPQRRHLVQGINQADSLAFDFHKWLHCPYDAGCLLIRDIEYLRLTFSIHQSQPYLASFERGCAGDKPWFAEFGPEITRTFRGLKVWFTLKEHGTTKLGQNIAKNCEQAQYLVSLLEKYDHLIHIIRPVPLNIVNFRFDPKELNEWNSESVDIFNNDLVSDIQEMGIATPSTTRIQNRLYIRVAITNHRSTFEDFDIFVKTFLHLCQTRLQLSSEKNN